MLDSLRSLLHGGDADEVVWTADITYWITGRKHDGTADPAWDTEEGYLELHRELGLLPYYGYSHFWAAQEHYAAGIESGTETEGHRTTHTIHTSAGDLTQETKFLPESCSTAIARHYVQSEAALDVLIHLLQNRILTPANLDDYEDRAKRWRGYDGIPAIGLPRSPLPALCCQWAGVQHLAYLMLDCEDKVRAAMALMEQQEEPILEALCAAAVPLVHFPDNLSSENLAGYYDRYMAAHHRQRIERLHDAGVACVVHLDGTVAGLLPKLAASGFDGIEAVTPKPVGDITASQMAELTDDTRVILWGGVPGAMFAPSFSWAEMEAHIVETLEAWRGRPFVLGVADQVPPDGDIDFCRRISELVKDFGT